ncbi:MAG: alpha/beta fold hydrolase [Solirubrobacteraceae bacterium]
MLDARRVPRMAPEPATMAVGTLPRRTVELPSGTVRYLRHGRGSPLLLVHGIPTSARLWEPLLGALGEHHDCIVPDLLGLGASVPAPGADLSSGGQATMLVELLDALGVDRCALVLHDQGGAHGQTLLVDHGDRIDAVAFVDVVCLDNWPVPAVDVLVALANRRWLLRALCRSRLLPTVMRRVWPLPQTSFRGLPRALQDEWLAPLVEGGPRLERWADYVAAQSRAWTDRAIPTLRAWERPAVVIWAAGDRHLPVDWAARLAAEIPGCDGGPVLIPHAAHFLQPEVPQTLAAELLTFLARALSDRDPEETNVR